jgi:maltose alpha-D-glucosyltransferase/alpha-amylase
MPAQPKDPRPGLAHEPLWYKSGVIYELHVRAFYDSDGDGTGDFRGLTEKLDYLRDLGITAIWLLPFYPSPLKDDGYDIANYCDVHPMYGTLEDFKTFLREAHLRGLRVITELVLNHTSDQHPWFQRARRAKPGSRWRNFYVWADDPQQYKDAPIIFNGVEASNWALDPVAGTYFWHRFFSHQPDLNFDNPEVRDEIFKVVDFWLDLGVDGLRLDAVPYLYERDGTTCENLPETHAFLKSLRAHVDEKYGDRMLLAEANLWPEQAVPYFGGGRGDECHMAFHFPLMPRLFMALRMEDRLPITEILEQTPVIPETSQWALFLRNHDELTLAIVTDEERDYMYRMYAQTHQARLYLGIRRRLAPLLGNDRKSIELLNALLFSLPGTPVLYYGDEIGLGDNIYLGDRNGVRTPMQWSSDKNAGFSRANPQSLYLPIILDPAYHYEAINVEEQLANPHSMLWWMRRLLALRKRWRALGEGKLEFLQPENHKILSYILRHEQETLLVVANLSRFVQPVELDLSAFKEMIPVELFGRTKFPVITDAPYLLTLGPHNFYWFSLEPRLQPLAAKRATSDPTTLPALTVIESWREIFSGKLRGQFESLLPDCLKAQPWFLSKNKTIKLATIRQFFKLPLPDENAAVLVFLQVEFVEANPELYFWPLAFAAGGEATRLQKNGIVELTWPDGRSHGLVYDALASSTFARTALELIQRRERLKDDGHEIHAIHTAGFPAALGREASGEPAINGTPDGNVIIFFGDKLAMKFFRRVEAGIHPEVEIGRFLTEKKFPNCAPLLASLEYIGADDLPTTLAIVKAFIPQAKNAWDFMLDDISRYYDRVFADAAQGHAPPSAPDEIANNVGTAIESARQLGARTAELHLALMSGLEGDEFSAEPMTPQYLRGLFQTMRSLATQNLRWLRKRLKQLPPDLAAVAQRVIELEPAIIQHYQNFTALRLAAKRTRVHGDFYLGQALWTGRDFMFLDFEGDANVPLSERRIKYSPLRDVARMVRSFHHAAYAGLRQQVESGIIPPDSVPRFEPWVRHWNRTISRAYLQSYCQSLGHSGILPDAPEQLQVMLLAYLLNQVVDELGDELRLNSDNVRAPLQAIILLTDERMLQQIQSALAEIRPRS